ncbi:hypothetical protein A8C32_19245 [Flavivirga aquatica]|uniref:Helicase ATP-binding domain-containing protein n=1 Tax=Flavivirga aquatica TaxID=1849968 RepID=A0A1E5T482_9FLAO|nr:DEAD/DEAH box helicase family protein [Flavivirga aquatica]OEK06166.1 hypothetical protein A8C32_19245 [Flavivirga aquatica]
MSSLLEKLNFIYSWRTYQVRILKNFEKYIEDNHFHFIAPPGSGKTILGIELIKRINKKTLVLSPTLTIRNQWEDRLQQFFTDKQDFKSVSFDIKNPEHITFITYQSLHAFYKTFETDEAYCSFFKTEKIEVFVLDEAHHLKNVWWKCLMKIKANKAFNIVALTATPPYDSEQAELSKYFELCGDIDEEISIPELVREQDLCPHQDFVYLSKPDDLEINKIVDFRREIADFVDKLVNDDVFIVFLKKHRFFSDTALFLGDIYSNIEYFSSLLIFLNTAGLKISYEKLKVLGFSKSEAIVFPELTLNWLAILFQNILINDREQLLEDKDYILRLEKQLKRLHAFNNKKVDFIGQESIYKSLTNSKSKLKSIVEILSSESNSLKEDLRCVILTDYIRKEFLNTTKEAVSTINKIGVIPIFHFTKEAFPNASKIAVLTGSIVIIHQNIIKAFNNLKEEDVFSYNALDTNNGFLSISTSQSNKKSIISIITKLFEKGIIQVIIGTKSLLGEGWDAPSINSLILASFVGSFVSSNQMRGRAIRKDELKSNKTGNIWHLACVDATQKTGGHDVEILRRRFDTFLGISNTDYPFIENGMQRLDFPEYILEQNIDVLNKATLKLASNRSFTAKKWNESIGNGMKISKKIKLNYLNKVSFKKQKEMYFLDVVRFIFINLTGAMLLFFLEFFLRNLNVVLNKGTLAFLYALIASFLLSFGYKLYKAIGLYIKHGFLYKKVNKIGYVVLKTFSELNFLDTDIKYLRVESYVENGGAVFCGLSGGTQLEETLFVKALDELLSPIKSPRYLITKTNFLKKKFDIENFYSVPEIFGDRKKNALVFQKHWKTYMGSSKLIYTRQLAGRKMLLKSRLFHVSSSFLKTSRMVSIWK